MEFLFKPSDFSVSPRRRRVPLRCCGWEAVAMAMQPAATSPQGFYLESCCVPRFLCCSVRHESVHLSRFQLHLDMIHAEDWNIFLNLLRNLS